MPLRTLIDLYLYADEGSDFARHAIEHLHNAPFRHLRPFNLPNEPIATQAGPDANLLRPCLRISINEHHVLRRKPWAVCLGSEPSEVSILLPRDSPASRLELKFFLGKRMFDHLPGPHLFVVDYSVNSISFIKDPVNNESRMCMHPTKLKKSVYRHLEQLQFIQIGNCKFHVDMHTNTRDWTELGPVQLPFLQIAEAIEPPANEAREFKETSHILGEGQYGKVGRSRNLESGEMRAYKHTDLRGPNMDRDLQQAKEEVRILMNASHENVVRCYDYAIKPVPGDEGATHPRLRVKMELELCAISLEDLIGNGKATEIVSVVGAHVGRGLQYLHSQHIIHRDLKPANVLVRYAQLHRGIFAADISMDEKFRMLQTCKIEAFCLSDFGFSRQSMLCSSYLGTPIYMAPEIFQGNRKYGMEVDLYAFGILLLQIMDPADFQSLRERYHRTYGRNFHGFTRFPRFVRTHLDRKGSNDSIWYLIRRLTAPRAPARPDIQSVVKYFEEMLSPSVPTNIHAPTSLRFQQTADHDIVMEGTSEARALMSIRDVKMGGCSSLFTAQVRAATIRQLETGAGIAQPLIEEQDDRQVSCNGRDGQDKLDPPDPITTNIEQALEATCPCPRPLLPPAPALADEPVSTVTIQEDAGNQSRGFPRATLACLESPVASTPPLPIAARAAKMAEENVEQPSRHRDEDMSAVPTEPGNAIDVDQGEITGRDEVGVDDVPDHVIRGGAAEITTGEEADANDEADKLFDGGDAESKTKDADNVAGKDQTPLPTESSMGSNAPTEEPVDFEALARTDEHVSSSSVGDSVRESILLSMRESIRDGARARVRNSARKGVQDSVRSVLEEPNAPHDDSARRVHFSINEQLPPPRARLRRPAPQVDLSRTVDGGIMKSYSSGRRSRRHPHASDDDPLALFKKLVRVAPGSGFWGKAVWFVKALPKVVISALGHDTAGSAESLASSSQRSSEVRSISVELTDSLRCRPPGACFDSVRDR